MKILKISSLFVLLATLFFACQKEYSLENALTPAGTWQFNDSTKLYAGNFDTVYISTNGTTKVLNLVGKSSDGQQNFLMHLYATDSFTVGSYKASLSQNDFQYYTQAKTFYQADQFIGEFIVNITSIGNGSVTGTFAGTVEDSTGTNKQLTAGKFTSRINLSANGTGGGGGTGTATGTLGASAGVCSQTTTSGTYTQGVSLTSANTATVQVNVTALGTYAITTNKVNGVSFSGTGTFSTLGTQNVILTGTGTPLNSGSQTFAVTFGSSTCNFTQNFAAGTAPATGTLGGSPGSCTAATTAGTFTQGTALTASNTVTVQVNVTTIGAYTISTNTVNGVSFSKTGAFTTTGLQNVVLVGTGTPTASGIQNFTVTFGTSTCNFSITFAPGTVVSDYFPTTTGSNWVYGNVADPTDSFKITATSQTITISSQLYNLFNYNSVPPSGSSDSLYYRKGGGLYYENFNVETLIGAVGTPPNVEYKFLDATVPAGTSWQSPSFTVTDQGVTYTIYLKMTLTAKLTTPTTSGVVTSSDVLKVNYDYYVSAAGVPATIFYKEERWFAKGIGLIYNSFDDLSGSPKVYKIGRYQVF